MMNEQNEQILSFAENELIDKEAIRRAALTETPQKQKKPVAWMKILLPIAACLVLLCCVVFAIPETRAEVVRWFRESGPIAFLSDYLAGGENEREAIPELSALVATPAADGESASLPVDHSDPQAVNSERATEVSDFLYANCDVTLGDALYDGEQIFQSVRLNGLAGLYLLEATVGGTETAVPVDPEAVANLSDPAPSASDGPINQYPMGYVIYELPDGTRQRGMLALSGAAAVYADTLCVKKLDSEHGGTAEALEARNRAYLNQNGLVAVATIVPYTEDWENYWKQYTDADGNMTVQVYYEVYVIEEDRGDQYIPPTELYSAALGSITIDMDAYLDVEQIALKTDHTRFVWGPDTVLISRSHYDYPENSKKLNITYTKYEVSMEGVTIQLDTENAKFSSIGVRDLDIRVTMPDTWTDGMMEALQQSLKFGLMLDYLTGDWNMNLASSGRIEDHAFVWTVTGIYGATIDKLAMTKSISIYPIISSTEEWTFSEPVGVDDDGNPVSVVNPPIGEDMTVHFKSRNFGFSGDSKDTPYYAYRVTLEKK